MKPWLIVLLILGASLLVIVMAYRGRSSGPERVVSQAIQSWNKQDMDGLLSTMDPKKEAAARLIMVMDELMKSDESKKRESGSADEKKIEEGLRELMRLGRLGEGPIQEKTQKADQAWITIGVTITVPLLNFETLTKMQFYLQTFGDRGWRIVDLQLRQ